MEAKQNGAKLAVLDLRLSNTASHADLWISPWPGSEAAIFLAVASHLLRTRRIDRGVPAPLGELGRLPRAPAPRRPPGLRGLPRPADRGLRPLHLRVRRGRGARPGRAGRASWPRWSADAGTRLATHTWRSAAAGNLGGWQIARSLFFLNVLTGSVGTEGGTHPNGWDKFIAHFPQMPEAERRLERDALAAGVPAHHQRDVDPAAAPAQGRPRHASRSTSAGSTTRCGSTPTASPGSTCSRTRTRWACTSRSRRRGASPRRSPTTCCRWGTPRSGTTRCRSRRTPRSGSRSASR